MGCGTSTRGGAEAAKDPTAAHHAAPNKPPAKEQSKEPFKELPKIPPRKEEKKEEVRKEVHEEKKLPPPEAKKELPPPVKAPPQPHEEPPVHKTEEKKANLPPPQVHAVEEKKEPHHESKKELPPLKDPKHHVLPPLAKEPSPALKAALEKIKTGDELNKLTLDLIFAELDPAHTGAIPKDKLGPFFTKHKVPAPAIESIVNWVCGPMEKLTRDFGPLALLGLFLHVPKEREEFISKAELRAIRRRYAQLDGDAIPSDADVDKAFDTNDGDHDGYVNVAEFYRCF